MMSWKTGIFTFRIDAERETLVSLVDRHVEVQWQIVNETFFELFELALNYWQM